MIDARIASARPKLGRLDLSVARQKAALVAEVCDDTFAELEQFTRSSWNP